MAQVSEIKKAPANRTTGYEYEKDAKFVAYVSSYTRGKGVQLFICNDLS